MLTMTLPYLTSLPIYSSPQQDPSHPPSHCLTYRSTNSREFSSEDMIRLWAKRKLHKGGANEGQTLNNL